MASLFRLSACASLFIAFFAGQTIWAALTLGFENLFLPPGDQFTVEAVFRETGPAVNEDFVAYTVGVNLVREAPAGPSALSFVAPFGTATTDHPYVLTGDNVPVIFATETDADSVWAQDDTPGATEDINDGEGLIKLHLRIDRTLLAPGVYHLVFDPAATEFGDVLGNEIPVQLQNGTIVIPEPTALSLLAISGAAMLARRRGAIQ